MGTGPIKINNSGQVVGRYSDTNPNIQTATDLRGFVWRNGQVTDRIAVPVTEGTNTVAADINDNGQILGLIDANGGFEGFLLSGITGGSTRIAFDPFPLTFPSGINNDGVIVGPYGALPPAAGSAHAKD